ncbi:RNA polymerase sigma-70 factor [Niabella sp.]|uniref:RNA polymerase sigma-70 factor n=1 Tax=Niabella sp. TaxID=1962976 RepID=UPI002634EBAD|nr:RNA polymerase sigma-70 factor [Niabella sp.]
MIAAIAENNDEQAFDELFRMFYPALLSYAQSCLKNKPVAEEICVDVMLKLWSNRKMLGTINNISNYLYVAVKHAVISYMRTSGYQREKGNISLQEAGEHLPFELSNQETRVISRETLDQINKAINELPDRCRLIFKLIKEDGLKYAEVATLLEISTKTVENQLAIAIKKLTESLKAAFRERRKKSS